MVTRVGQERAVVALVRDLIILEYDAIAAYKQATERLKDRVARDHMAACCRDHQRHVRELSDWMRTHGETPPVEGDMKAALTQGKVLIGGLMGDRTVLQAMRTNEDDTCTAYGRAAQRDDLDADLAALLQAILKDERVHCDWMLSYLKNTSGD